MAYKEDLDIGKIALISLVSVLLTVAIVLFLQVLFYGFKQRQLASPRYSQVPAEMTKYVADQRGKLASYEVVDRERKVVTMPIDRAMEMVVVELEADAKAHVTGVLDPADVVQPPPDQTPPDGPKKTPVYKKAWFWSVIGAAVLLVAGGTAGYLIWDKSQPESFNNVHYLR